MKRIVSLFLAVSVIAGLLSLCSCSSETGTGSNIEETESIGAAESVATENEPVTEVLTDGLDNIDFDGEEYTILMTEAVRPYMLFTVDEMNGDSLNDVAYERERDTEERFNVSIEVIPDIEHATEFSTHEKYIAAGEYLVDLIQPNGNGYGNAGKEIAGGYLLDWTDLEDVDFSKPWWNISAINSTSSNNRVYAAYGDLTILRNNVSAILFNKKLMDNYGIKAPYESVLNGTWSADELLSIIKQGAADINGDGVMDQNDQYGFVVYESGLSNYQFLFGANVAGFNSKGEIELTIDSDKLQGIAEKVAQINSPEFTYCFPGSDNEAPLAMFADERGLMYQAPFGLGYRQYRSIDRFDYGVIPIPKYDELQENYKSGTPVSLYISAFTQNKKLTGVISEALSAYSYFHVRKAFIEDMLYGKLARDEKSEKMIDIILDSSTIGIIQILVSEQNLNNIIRYCVNNKSTDVQSYIEANRAKTEVAIESLNESLRAK